MKSFRYKGIALATDFRHNFDGRTTCSTLHCIAFFVNLTCMNKMFKTNNDSVLHNILPLKLKMYLVCYTFLSEKPKF